jgi:hypothetical protein
MTVEPPQDGDPVSRASRLLRLPKSPPDFLPDRWKPSDKQFEPSTDDKKHADERGTPVRVSVWDEARTSPAQARSFRSSDVLVLAVAGAALTEVSADTGRAIRAVYEPLDPPDRDLPGADGHAGIEGLDRQRLSRPKWRSILCALADRAVLIDGPRG